MAKRHQAAQLLLMGLNPIQIATELGVSVNTVMPYLYHQVGVGSIRRTEILYSLPKDIRHNIESLIRELSTTYWYDIFKASEKRGLKIERAFIEIYIELRDGRIAMGDMYELLHEIELTLHTWIKREMISKYGPNEHEWWRKGVPISVRRVCAASYEEDNEPASDRFNYTTLIHLKETIEHNWQYLSKYFPKFASDKKELSHLFAKLNRIRNGVMHPVKGISITEDDFELVYEFHREVIMPLKRSTGTNRDSNGVTPSLNYAYAL